MTKVSFVIPVRDDAARLARCLERIRSNRARGVAIEAVVVDNGSRDRSAAVARAAGAIVIEAPGVPVAVMRNRGAARAGGDVVAFVDADHEIESSWARHAIAALTDARVGAAGAAYHAPQNGTWVQRTYDTLRTRVSGRRDVEWLGSGNLAVRRDAFRSVGGFDTSLETCEDVDLCQRLRAAGYRVVSDERLRSVHLGDPATLGALFRSELWRGRDNLRLALRGPLTWRGLPSVAIPVADLLAVGAIAAGAVAATRGGLPIAFAAAAVIAALASLRAAKMLRARGAADVAAVGQTFAVAITYDLARALALVCRATHRTRHAAPEMGE
jgi:GT2 family glycosyltransferase